MTDVFFTPADILLPTTAFEIWSVIACDQFTSDKGYWERVRGIVGDRPSTLNMILPETFLGEVDVTASARKISESMGEYLQNGVFHELPDSLIYLERTLGDGRVRRGLVGAIDLEKYEYEPGAQADILASEGTILDRLPPRVAVREIAPLELPHVMAFIDDEARTVIEPLGAVTGELEQLYNFELMEGGGYIRGWRVCGDSLNPVIAALHALKKGGATVIIGDGNHSLAAAKTYWDSVKNIYRGVGVHPARYALVELGNVYDEAIDFEAIHRVVFTPDPAALTAEFCEEFDDQNGYEVRWMGADSTGCVKIQAGSIGELIGKLQTAIDRYAARENCEIDYIHGADEAVELIRQKSGAAFILPSMSKSDFFETVRRGGVFPRKSFSVGSARDKRYYLECRRIKPE